MQLSGHLGAVSESDLLGCGSKLVLKISVMGSHGTPEQSLGVGTHVSMFSTFELLSDSVSVKEVFYLGFTAPTIGRSSGVME